MLPDTETLKSLLSDLQTSGAGSRLRVATRTIESMRVELLAEVIRLREQLATVEGERDKAKKEAAENMAGWRAAIRNGNGLYTAIVDCVRPFFPADSRDLEWDVLPGTLRTVARERDEAHAEVERLREQLNPTTPAGKLSAYRAAEAMVKNPPKVVGGWEVGHVSDERVRRNPKGWVILIWRNGKYAVMVGSPDGALPGWTPGTMADADAALVAAGWELAGGTE